MSAAVLTCEQNRNAERLEEDNEKMDKEAKAKLFLLQNFAKEQIFLILYYRIQRNLKLIRGGSLDLESRVLVPAMFTHYVPKDKSVNSYEKSLLPQVNYGNLS